MNGLLKEPSCRIVFFSDVVYDRSWMRVRHEERGLFDRSLTKCRFHANDLPVVDLEVKDG